MAAGTDPDQLLELLQEKRQKQKQEEALLQNLSSDNLRARVDVQLQLAEKAFDTAISKKMRMHLDNFPQNGEFTPAQRKEVINYFKGISSLNNLYKQSQDMGQNGSKVGNQVNYAAFKNTIICTGSTISDKFNKLLNSQFHSVALLTLVLTLMLYGFNKVLAAMGVAPILDATQGDAHRRALYQAGKARGWQVQLLGNGASFFDKEGNEVDASELLEDLQNRSTLAGYKVTTEVISTEQPLVISAQSQQGGMRRNDSQASLASVENVGPPGANGNLTTPMAAQQGVRPAASPSNPQPVSPGSVTPRP